MVIPVFILLLCGCGPDNRIEKKNTDTTLQTTPDTSQQADTVTSQQTATDTTSDAETDTERTVPVEDVDGGLYTRIIAIGDNHADLSQTQRALQIGKVIDDSLQWIGRRTIVVQTGDVIDRGEEEREVIDFYEALRPEAEAQGGRIINMNGNHEIMAALGDYRYLQEGACAAFSDLADLDLDNPVFDQFDDVNCKRRAAAFWPGGPYARIIADWPMVAVVEDTVFVHGGLHQKHIDYGIDEINRMTERWLRGEGELDTEQVGGGPDVFSVDWDRTYSSTNWLPEDTQCAVLKSVLDQLGVVRMVVGHTVQPRITVTCDGMVDRIDTGMSAYYGGKVEVLEIIDGHVDVLAEPD